MIRPLLLDTCAAMYVVAGDIAPTAMKALSKAFAADLPTYISPITAWEIGILARSGRFKSSYSPQRWFEVLMSKPKTRLAEMPPKVLLESAFLPGPIHKDPADRIIAATAREYGFTVMTRDTALLDYAAQGYLAAVEC